MPSMTLFEGGLAPANDNAVVNKSIRVPSWWLTWQHEEITQLWKHTKKLLCAGWGTVYVHTYPKEIPRGREPSKVQIFKRKYEKELEFQEVLWGFEPKKPPGAGFKWL